MSNVGPVIQIVVGVSTNIAQVISVRGIRVTWWSGPLLCMTCTSQPWFLFTEELVHSGLCAMHLGHNSIFPSARIKMLLQKYE
jgi:hypothetical protein